MAKHIYNKTATTFDEQIAILRGRNVIIRDESKAKEYLSDIGYYRLGFYSHPFEITYPLLNKQRKHDVKPGTTIEDIVALYYYDFDLRTILNKYLSRVEVSIRTTIIYYLSNKYKSDPYWFVNPLVVCSKFISDFPKKVYPHIATKPPIVAHHKKYQGDYAPAWKTMEYMTMGNLEVLYNSLNLDADKRLISNNYNEPSIDAFGSYLATITSIRNACAHGNVLFRHRLQYGIISGMACNHFIGGANQKFAGAILVLDYLLKQVSTKRSKDMWKEIYAATERLYKKVPSINPLIEAETGIILPQSPTFFQRILKQISKIFLQTKK